MSSAARERTVTCGSPLPTLPSAETRAHAVIGTLGTCAAFLSFDAGEVDTARALDADALYAAHLANDKNLQVQVLQGMALQARWHNRAGEAMQLAESAMTIARGLDLRIQSRLAADIADAAAQQRDNGTFQKQRGQTWRLLERADGTDRPAWLQFFDERRLPGCEALSLLRLGRYTEATAVLRKATANPDGLLRLNATDAAVQAVALLKANELDEAIAIVHDALPFFTEVISARTYTWLARVRDALQPYAETNPDAAEYRDILTGLLLQPAGRIAE